VNVVRCPARDGLHRGVDDRAAIHPAVLVEVGVEHPRRQRLTELKGNRSSACAHNHACNPLRVRHRREQGGGGSQVRRDDMRRAETGVGNELGEESARTFPIDEEFVFRGGWDWARHRLWPFLPGRQWSSRAGGGMHGVFEIPRGMVAPLLRSR
jgi:hypothetical protein